jgi:hypothetical protein
MLFDPNVIQQEELDDATKWLKDYADEDIAEMAHEYIGAYPMNWNPAGIPTFQEELAKKLLVQFYPGPHCKKFW